jgi:hypothetical protein
MADILLPCTYLGPVHYYAKFLQGNVIIEQYDSYVKQSYRNRCVIVAANGTEILSIPVLKPSGSTPTLKDVRIDNNRSWRQQHWRALISAYNSTPFFEYYADDFSKFYEKPIDFLLDLNLNLLDCVLENIGIDRKYILSDHYSKDFTGSDMRESIHPKQQHTTIDKTYRDVPYYQVFATKHGFIPNVSIVDLLFNCGPESLLILKDSIK